MDQDLLSIIAMAVLPGIIAALKPLGWWFRDNPPTVALILGLGLGALEHVLFEQLYGTPVIEPLAGSLVRGVMVAFASTGVRDLARDMNDGSLVGQKPGA